MWDDLDFELIDDADDGQDTIEVETKEWTDDSDSDESKQDSEDNTTSAKRNKSNFKKISKLNKALMAENKKLRAEKAKQAKAKQEDDFEDLEYDDVEVFDKTEFRFFLIENPEAKEYSGEIKDIMSANPTLDLDDALALAKAKKPKESTSSNDFNTKSVNTKVRKKLSDLTEEEALQLSPKKFLEYQRVTGVLRK